MSRSLAILFVDWLELLDPEIVQASPELSQQLMFARQCVGASGRAQCANSQPYLLALLTHQTSWVSLHRCIDCLLKAEYTQRFVVVNMILPFPNFSCFHSFTPIYSLMIIYSYICLELNNCHTLYLMLACTCTFTKLGLYTKILYSHWHHLLLG